MILSCEVGSLLHKEKMAYRASIIEECARVAETFHCAKCGVDAATAIRALKHDQISHADAAAKIG